MAVRSGLSVNEAKSLFQKHADDCVRGFVEYVNESCRSIGGFSVHVTTTFFSSALALGDVFLGKKGNDEGRLLAPQWISQRA